MDTRNLDPLTPAQTFWLHFGDIWAQFFILFRCFSSLAPAQKISTDAELIEKLVRQENVALIRVNRKHLATETARLGKIVYSRTGSFGDRLIESWEDGYAAVDLNDKLKQLKTRREELLERQKISKKAMKQLAKSVAVTPDSNGDSSILMPPPSSPIGLI